VAAPEPKASAPLFPWLEVPDENTKIPLTPSNPELAVRMRTLPLVVAVPSPLATLNEPPVLTVLRPETTVMLPPRPDLPAPTRIVMLPPRPAFASPLETNGSPRNKENNAQHCASSVGGQER
jgi:hypothetical protein